MGLLGTTTQESYYNQSQTFIGTGSQTTFTVLTSAFTTRPVQQQGIDVYINNKLIAKNTYSYNGTTVGDTSADSSYNIVFNNSQGIDIDVQQADGSPNVGLSVLFRESTGAEQYGGYQFISIDDIINNFMFSYVGEDKIINRAKKADVAFHAKRGLQELSYDTLKSVKSQEIELPPTLTMALPQDYVNYVKITYSDSSGLERNIYPSRDTSNPLAILQDDQFKYLFDSDGKLQTSYNSSTWHKFSGATNEAATNTENANTDLTSTPLVGGRYGITPEYAQANGTFFIDQAKGSVYFSSNMSGQLITLKYISDSLGTDSEMIVHKFAEEAMYKHIAHAVLASKVNIPEYIVSRFKKERFAATRVAKLRLSNLKSEELTLIMRNKSKQLKH